MGIIFNPSMWSKICNRQLFSKQVTSFWQIMSGTIPKEKRICSAKVIGTHNGTFHCDDALACYMLRILPEYKDAKWVMSQQYNNNPDFMCALQDSSLKTTGRA